MGLDLRIPSISGRLHALFDLQVDLSEAEGLQVAAQQTHFSLSAGRSPEAMPMGAVVTALACSGELTGSAAGLSPACTAVAAAADQRVDADVAFIWPPALATRR